MGFFSNTPGVKLSSATKAELMANQKVQKLILHKVAEARLPLKQEIIRIRKDFEDRVRTIEKEREYELEKMRKQYDNLSKNLEADHNIKTNDLMRKREKLNQAITDLEQEATKLVMLRNQIVEAGNRQNEHLDNIHRQIALFRAAQKKQEEFADEAVRESRRMLYEIPKKHVDAFKM